MVSDKCRKCCWFDTRHRSLEGLPVGSGYCRRLRPQVFVMGGRYYGGWPLVDAEDFCGEFREDK